MILKSVEELQEAIKNNSAVLLYFSSPLCSVCGALKPKMFKEANERYPNMSCFEVDISISPEVGVFLSVLAAPTVVIFLGSKEFARKSRAFSPSQLLDEVQRPYDILIDFLQN